MNKCFYNADGPQKILLYDKGKIFWGPSANQLYIMREAAIRQTHYAVKKCFMDAVE